MKTLLFCLGLTASVGCSPTAEAMCETLSGCAGGATVDGCLESLRTARDSADERGCVDEYYAALNCQVNMEPTCDDVFFGRVAKTCSAELCEYRACSKQEPRDRCSGDPLDPTGTWLLQMQSTSCPTAGVRSEIKVTKTDGQFQLMLTGAGMLTGTVEASHNSAHLMATLVEGSLRVEFAATATGNLIPDASPVATITGNGHRTQSTCSDQVLITGELYRP